MFTSSVINMSSAALYLTALIAYILFIIYYFVITKKVNIVGCLLTVCTLILNFTVLPDNRGLKILWLVIISICFVLLNIGLYLEYNIKITRIEKILEQSKNDSVDLYFGLNKKNKITDFSVSYSKYLTMNKKEIYKKNGWDLFFEVFDVLKINDQENIISNKQYFINHLADAVEDNKKYEFTVDIKQGDEIVHYNGLIQPIYFKKIYCGSAVYIYKDQSIPFIKLQNKLDAALLDVEYSKRIAGTLMSLSEGVCLYYSFIDSTFNATTGFQNFIGNNKHTYSFEEIYNMIEPEDLKLYEAQSKTINSIYVTRLKYHMWIKDVKYNVVEDSMYLNDNGSGLVSLIHVVSKADAQENTEVLSTEETKEIINELSIIPAVDDVERAVKILKETLAGEFNE